MQVHTPIKSEQVSTFTRADDSPICLPRATAPQIELRELPPNPLVSVVVPSFNQGNYIRATIDSILSQNYRPLQIIVIDGASQDQTVAVLKSYGEIPELEWVSEPDSGVVEAVNKGFARVRGNIVAIQSSDDCYLPGAICEVVREFGRDAQVGLLYGDTVKVDADGHALSRQSIGPYTLMNLLRIKTWIPQSSAFFRKELLDALGGWDDRIPYAPDTDLWLRMAFRTCVRKVDIFLSQRRCHDQQRDTQVAKIARDFTRMIEQSSEIANSTTEIRNAAHAGKYLMCVRYNSRGSDWHVAWCLFRAGLCDRACLDLRGIAIHLFWLPLRRRMSIVKRVFGRWSQA